MLALMDPEIEWHLTFRLPDVPPDKTVFRGHEEVRALMTAFRDVWEELEVDLEEVVHDSEGLLVTRVRFHGIGSGSGVEVDRVVYYVQEIGEDMRLVRIQPFDDLAEARRAAGLGDG